MTNAAIWIGWALGGSALLYLIGCIYALLVWSRQAIPVSSYAANKRSQAAVRHGTGPV